MNDKISSIKIDGVGYEIQDLEAKTRIDEIENSYVKATDTVEEVTSIEETLVTNALRKTAQTLTAAEKSQVQKNIGVDAVQQQLQQNINNVQQSQSQDKTNLLKSISTKGVSVVPSYNGTLTGILPNIDTLSKTLDLGEDPVLLVGDKSYGKNEFAGFNHRAIPLYVEGNPTGAVKLVFNIDEKRVYPVASNKILDVNEALIGGVRLVYSTHEFIRANFPFSYSVDGKDTGATNVNFIPSSDYIPNIDTLSKTLDLGEDPVLLVGDKSYGKNEFAEDFDFRNIPIYVEGNPSGAIKMVFSVAEKRAYCVPSKQSLGNSEVVIGGFRLKYDSHDFISASLPFDYTVDGGSQLLWSVPVIYSKAGILNKIHETKAGILSQGSYLQGCDIHNGILFQGQDGGVINIYDADNSFSHINGYQSVLSLHMTNLSFGNEKVNDSDEFPLLYIPENGQRGYELYALRVTRSSSELVQTLSFPKNEETVGYYPVSIVDKKNNYVYCWGYIKNSYSDANNNAFVITKYVLPKLSEGNVTMTLIDRFVVPYRGIGQGACTDGVNLYFQCGLGNSPTYLQVINLFNRCEIGLWDISEATTAEPEGVCIHNGKLLSVHNNRDVHYIEF